MKKLGALLSIILCIGIIIAGQTYWKSKIASSAESNGTVETDTKIEDKKISEKVEDSKSETSIYATNLPSDVIEKIKKAEETGESLNLVIYGSEASSPEQGAWPEILEKELNSTYGENIITVSVISERSKTTLDVVNEKGYEKVNKAKPDLVLFEPFILKDNGNIGIDNTLENITTMISSFEEQNPEISIMLQPAHPLFDAVYYPKEIVKLKDYAKENGITYLDHWESWPEQDNEKLKDYLEADNSVPNEKGNEVWGQYLVDYFIAE